MQYEKSVFPPPLWWVKLTQYEYWPATAYYLPLAPFLIWQAVRARSATFFTAVNPAIESSGFVGEQKMAILGLLPSAYLPVSVLVDRDAPLLQILRDNRLSFPLIAKPNVGERGKNVVKIESFEALETYHQQAELPYILQEYINLPLELGIFYSRIPGEKTGRISSVTLKEFLSVTGDGAHTLGELIASNPRARFQEERLKVKYADQWFETPPAGVRFELEPIGNHCRGTRFINANHRITPQLEAVFDQICRQIDGFYYGRFDLRTASFDDLYAGKNIKMMELNGVSSEPGHIYDASFGLLNAYKNLAWHWKRVADISIENQKRGIKPMSLTEFWKLYKRHVLQRL